MIIDSPLLSRLGKLARLRIDREEMERLGGELSRLLTFFGLLDEIDRLAPAPPDPMRAEQAPLRPDATRASLTRDEALGPAPASLDGEFAVPGLLPPGEDRSGAGQGDDDC